MDSQAGDARRMDAAARVRAMTSRTRALAVAVLAALACGGGYLAGRAGGADPHGARLSGRRAGRTAGEAAGYQSGYRAGAILGERAGYRRAYGRAYRVAWREALRP